MLLMINKCKHGVSIFLDVLSSCLMPLIPMLIAASMFKTLAAILGPDMLHWVSDKDALYILLIFTGDAGFYFFPIMIGYTAAKHFNCNVYRRHHAASNFCTNGRKQNEF